jgi:hypothetical protein
MLTDDIIVNANAIVMSLVVGEGRLGDEANQDIKLRTAVEISKKKVRRIVIERGFLTPFK